jgi:hypothetical protein
MPVFTPTVGTGPREELALAIVEGEGAVKNLIGDKIMPAFPITKRTAHLPKLTIANTQGMRMIADQKFLRAPGTKYERFVASVNDATINTDLRGAEIVIPNEVEMEWDEYLDLVAFFTARFGQEISGFTKEFLVTAAVFNVANTFSGAATNATNAYTVANRDIAGALGMNPIQDIIARIRYLKSIGEAPDFVAMSGPVWERVRTAANTLAFVRGIFVGIAEVNSTNFTNVLAEYGIKDIFIGDAYYNNAADGATPSLVQLWSNTYVAIGRRGMASVPSGSEGVGVPTLAGFGVSAFWTGFKPGGRVTTDEGSLSMAGGSYVETYPQLDINSLVVRVGMSAKPFVANNRCLDLLATNYA